MFDFLGLDLPGFLENLVVQVLDDVELIEDDLRFGQELFHYGGIGGIHVARHGINLITEAFVHEHLKDGLDRLLCLAFDNRKDLAGIVVDEDRCVSLSLVNGYFVNSNSSEISDVDIGKQGFELFFIEASHNIPAKVEFRSDGTR